ncbi:MAG: cytochrome c oxidase subunit II [Pseudomonadota bacterium]
MRGSKLVLGSIAGLGAAGAAGMAGAQDALERIGKPEPGALHWQPAATELARDIHWLDGFLLVIISAICLFVVGLLAYVIFKFNAKAHPEPKTFTHHSTVEVVWTVVPILILVTIGAFSLPVLFKQLNVPESDLTIKVTGYQWYWGYEYPDQEIDFEGVMLARSELAEYGYTDDEYLLATDTAMVVPEGAVVKLLMTADPNGVIHSWTIPAFGVKMDAIPGRTAETWFQADRVGVYFGQCSELCGKDHAYMPIVVKVLPQAEYEAWLTETQLAQGVTPGTGIRLASN